MSKTPAERKAAQRERDLKKINFVKDNYEMIRSSLIISIEREERVLKDCFDLEQKKGVNMQRVIDNRFKCIEETKKLLDELEQVR